MTEENTDQTAEENTETTVNIQIEDAGTLKKKIIVTVSESDIAAKRDEMFGELNDTAQIPGFRIGHAPRRLVEKRFGKEVSQDVRNALLGDTIGKAMEQSELNILGEPDVKLDDIELPESGELVYDFEVEIAPEFELPELTGMKIEKVVNEVTDDSINEYVEEIRKGRATYEPTEDAATESDMVDVESEVVVEGNDPVSNDSLSIRVAPGQIEGLPLVELGNKLAGKKAGDSVELKITVPAAHPTEEWRDKEATVKLTVKTVKKQTLPATGDDFAKSLGFADEPTFKDFVRERMETRVVEDTQRHMRDQITTQLMDATEFELPEGVAAKHAERTLQRRYVDLMRQGVSKEMIDENITALQAAAQEQAKVELKRQFILGKVADQFEIEVTDEDLNNMIASMAAQYGRRPEQLRQELTADGTIESVSSAMREDAALDKLIEQGEVTEISEEEAKKRAEADAKKAEKKAAKKAAKKTAKKDDSKDEDKSEEKTEEKAEKKTEKKAATKTVKKTAKKTAKKSTKKED